MMPDPAVGVLDGSKSQPVNTGLSGKRIVVTRASHQAAEMADLLCQYGAEPVLYPCIAIHASDEITKLDKALGQAESGSFDWLILTSVNTVLVLSQRLEKLGYHLADVRIAAIGPKTAVAARELLRLDVDLIADQYRAESLAAALQPVEGLRLLLPQSAIARPVLAEQLRAHGAEVVPIDAYQTVMGQGGCDVPALLAAGRLDAITFTSSSTVEFFMRRLLTEGGHRGSLVDLCLAAIGPVTAKVIETLTLPVTVMPAEYTVTALVAALEDHFRL